MHRQESRSGFSPGRRPPRHEPWRKRQESVPVTIAVLLSPSLPKVETLLFHCFNMALGMEIYLNWREELFWPVRHQANFQ